MKTCLICFKLLLSENSATEQSDSIETHSSNNDIGLGDETSEDQSEAFICDEGQSAGVADAALQDGKNKAGTAANFIFFDIFCLCI